MIGYDQCERTELGLARAAAARIKAVKQLLVRIPRTGTSGPLDANRPHLLLALSAVMCTFWLTACSPRSSTQDSADAPEVLELQLQQVQTGASRRIELQQRIVSDDDLRRIGQLADLEELLIEHSTVTDAGLAHVANLKNLRSLKIRGGNLGDAGLRRLAELPRLRHMNLPQGQFSDSGIAALKNLPQLELLRFGSPQVTDAALSHIAEMAQLRFLHLIDTPITDKGLEALHGMRHLESFYLDGSQVSDEAIGQLLRALPDLHLHIDQQHPDYDPRKQTHEH